MKKSRATARRRVQPPPPGETLESARDGLIQALRDGEAAAWRSGRCWAELRKLGASRHTTAEEFLDKELRPLGIEPPSGSELAHRTEVATTFSEDVAGRVGMGKLHRTLVLWRHLGKTDFSTEDPGGESIDIPLPNCLLLERQRLKCTPDA